MKKLISLILILNSFLTFTQEQVEFEYKMGKKEYCKAKPSILKFVDDPLYNHASFIGTWKNNYYMFSLRNGNAQILKYEKNTLLKVNKISNTFSMYYQKRHYEKVIMIKDKIYFIYSRYDKPNGLKSFYYHAYNVETMEEEIKQTFIGKVSGHNQWNSAISLTTSQNKNFVMQVIYESKNIHLGTNLRLYNEKFDILFSKTLDFSDLTGNYNLQTYVTNDGWCYIILYGEKDIIFYQIIENESVKKIIIPVSTTLIDDFTFSVNEDGNIFCYFLFYFRHETLLVLDFFNEEVNMTSDEFDDIEEMVNEEYISIGKSLKEKEYNPKYMTFSKSFFYNKMFYVFKNKKSIKEFETTFYVQNIKTLLSKYNKDGKKSNEIDFNNNLYNFSFMIFDSYCYIIFQKRASNKKELDKLTLNSINLESEELTSTIIKEYKKNDYIYINILTFPDPKEKTFYLIEKPRKETYSRPEYISSKLKIK